MKKQYAVTLTAIFSLFSTNLIFTDSVSAQMSIETQQILQETNSLIQEASKFLLNQEREKQQEMNALLSSCNSGNSQACLQYEIRLRAEDRAIDNYINTSRNQRLCGSTICY